eukprot:2814734-Pyramimonas_sp.AAC.1
MGVVAADMDLDFAKGRGRRDERQRCRSPEELRICRPGPRAYCGLGAGVRGALSDPFTVTVPRGIVQPELWEEGPIFPE